MKNILLISIYFALSFCLAVFLHELGHYLMAKYLKNEDIHLSYNAVYSKAKGHQELQALYQQYKKEIKQKKTFPQKAYFDKLTVQVRKDYYLTTVAGPLLILLIGSLACCLLIIYPTGLKEGKSKSWILFYLATFLGAFLLEALVYLLGKGNIKQMGLVKIAEYWHLPQGFFVFVLAGLTTLALSFIFLKLLPSKQRIPILVGAIIGIVLGYFVWFEYFGPFLLPKG